MITNSKSNITGVTGWLTPLEDLLLYNLAQQVPDFGVVCEIGSEYGRSTSLFCKGTKPNVQIHCVDIFPVDHRGDMATIHENNLIIAGYGNRVIRHKGDSSAFGKVWQHDNIDLCFVDGDHSYDGVMRDIRAWTPHVLVHGLVAFHDTAAPTNTQPHELHWEVQKAIDDWIANERHRWNEHQSVDSIRVFERVAK